MSSHHVLVTGHTGFKGAWLTVLLKELGHKVSGVALDPIPGALFEQPGFSDLLENDFRLDIRDAEKLEKAIATAQPEVVIHMAAQPLVLASWDKPRETFETNVMGTFNVLEAARKADSVRAVLVVTTDKVYAHRDDSKKSFVESDPLGSADPYSTSKAMADLMTQTWSKANPSIPLAIARAGNVIGGGDVSENRLLPDLVRSFIAGEPALIRNPGAVRPWQHVLDCLFGYVTLMEALLDGKGEGAWNFGPSEKDLATVEEVTAYANELWLNSPGYLSTKAESKPEAEFLSLDATKARTQLNWSPRWNFKTAISETLSWEKRRLSGKDSLEITKEQVNKFRAADSLHE